MEPQPFSIVLAGMPLTIQPLCNETAQYFGDFCQPAYTSAPVIALKPSMLSATRAAFALEMSDDVLEYNILVSVVCDALLPLKRCIFHGTAFLWRGKAYIFTAPSGTGKTTQYVHWRHLYGDELHMLNGDKPVLECQADGTVWVYPSPWMGKEGWGRMISAPLGGLIYLTQNPNNQFSPLSMQQAVRPIFSQFLFTANSAEAVHQVCAIEEQMLRSVPVWHLANRGDEASARLCHDTLLQFEEGCV